ncbi:Signal-transduction histidine kinase senX3 [Aliarcobacter thereius]|uniref:histidine kinase n=2 Tax=Aliarcobacter thereius TaxID=544718 RepID=A0A1C0BA05_9BACT|nr:Signal-transduction histidine kinase senX3 [Aliarcobacter thereius]OCL94972.1 Signal-transduction histidine kinase senX3 [Aliarcobacter thereius LMG 24486]OCL91930.1 Signal-transduction histidine kinase senX3 [Aliarcobacter thereius]OCM00420.1 Signal-transduction histidine kinase senX3 [Aliarcobacter thereius]QBF15155.1 two-component system sensor histidine kinase, putative CusS [Aliarcobacter thereius LMG 24486]
MVIKLTSKEKKSFFRFLSLYLGSSFILLLLSLFFYYQNEKTLYIDLVKSNMQTLVSKASNEIIVSHMSNKKFNKDNILNNNEYKIAFYNKEKEYLFGSFNDELNEDIGFFYNEEKIKLIDNSTVGHLGIWYIVLEDFSLNSRITSLKYQIFIIFILVYLIISLVGYSLAKLFLKPIEDERDRLNNFIKDTTHELNTPISAIIMSSQDKNLSEKQIERIKLSAKRVSEIYSDLTYLFLDNKNKRIEEELDLKKIIEEEIIAFEPMISRKKIKVKFNLKEFSYKIDRDDFIRVFNNLISNAIKYNKMGGDIEIILNDNSLEIKDSGIGIDRDKIDDIFKRYYRATTQSGGFGLGLNIVNMICTNYKIKLEIESIKNNGSTFKLIF